VGHQGCKLIEACISEGVSRDVQQLEGLVMGQELCHCRNSFIRDPIGTQGELNQSRVDFEILCQIKETFIFDFVAREIEVLE
jgi:hypothetical protein